jgi:hypothetical protein
VIRAAALALFSALAGGAIALLARRRPAVLERTRTFAFAAAAGVVAFHLLPDVLPAQGLTALLWIGFGFALPWVLEAGARTFGPGLLEARGLTGMRVAAEVGFAALIFHSVAEGLALVAALAQPHGQTDLEIALVAHHAPLTAAVVLPFLDLRGPRSAGLRAASIGAAGVLGVLLSAAVPGFSEGAFLQIATAVTAGALLHVVSDEIRGQRFSSGWERAADLGACAAGLLVAGLGAVLQLRQNAAGPVLEFIRVLAGISIACAPALLAGVLAAALLPPAWRSFRWDAALLSFALLGPWFALALAALSVLPKIGYAAKPGVISEVEDEVRQRAPRLLMLIVLAAGLEVATPALPGGLLADLVISIVLLLAARLDPAGAVAMSAVLVRKGFDPGVAVAVIALGPMLAAAVRRAATRRRAAIAVALFVAAVFASNVLASARVAADHAFLALREPLLVQARAAPIGAASAAVLVLLALRTLWSEGARGWFAPLRHGPGAVTLQP